MHCWRHCDQQGSCSAVAAIHLSHGQILLLCSLWVVSLNKCLLNRDMGSKHGVVVLLVVDKIPVNWTVFVAIEAMNCG